jgi:hypothetical protein
MAVTPTLHTCTKCGGVMLRSRENGPDPDSVATLPFLTCEDCGDSTLDESTLAHERGEREE